MSLKRFNYLSNILHFAVDFSDKFVNEIDLIVRKDETICEMMCKICKCADVQMKRPFR